MPEIFERFGARKMDVVWMDDNYWTFGERDDSYFREVAILKSVCWLDVRLTYKGVPRGKYSCTWRMTMPTIPIEKAIFFAKSYTADENSPACSVEYETNLSSYRRGTGWVDVKVEGVLEVKEENGNLNVGFYQHDDECKEGLLIDYVEIKSVN